MRDPRQLIPNDSLIAGRRIAWGVHGEGAPVVLMHGTPSASYIWRDVLGPLVAAGRRVHLFDLLGYGASERPAEADADSSVAGQTALLHRLLDHWGLAAAHIVGHDIAGAVAQKIAVETPARVSSLTLIDSVSFDSWPSEFTKKTLADGIEALSRAPAAEHRARMSDWLKTAVADVETFEREALPFYLDLISGPVGQASYFQHQMATYESSVTEALGPLLHRLARTPTLILWGAEERWQLLHHARRLHDAIPGSALHILEGAGHFAMEDKPAEIAALIAEHTAPR